MSKKIDPNLMIAIGVLIASFGALFVYIRQASIMNEQTKILLEQTKASTWPHLSIGLGRTFEEGELSNLNISVGNKGVGPAILNYAILRYKDQPFENWNQFYQNLDLEKGTSITYSNEAIFDKVIAANSYLDFVEWNDPNLLPLIYERAHAISLEICYQSIHGDAWIIKRNGFQSNLEINERSAVDTCISPTPIIFKE